MKIKILTNCAGLKFSYSAGETVNADDTIANDLIQAGYAKVVGSKQSAEKADLADAMLPEGAETDGKSDNAADSGTGGAE